MTPNHEQKRKSEMGFVRMVWLIGVKVAEGGKCSLDEVGRGK